AHHQQQQQASGENENRTPSSLRSRVTGGVMLKNGQGHLFKTVFSAPASVIVVLKRCQINLTGAIGAEAPSPPASQSSRSWPDELSPARIVFGQQVVCS